MFSECSGQWDARWHLIPAQIFALPSVSQALSVLIHGYQISQAVCLTAAIFSGSLLWDQMKHEFTISDLHCFECLQSVTLSGRLWGPAIHTLQHSATPSPHHNHSSATQINNSNKGYHTSWTEAQASLKRVSGRYHLQIRSYHNTDSTTISQMQFAGKSFSQLTAVCYCLFFTKWIKKPFVNTKSMCWCLVPAMKQFVKFSCKLVQEFFPKFTKCLSLVKISSVTF